MIPTITPKITHADNNLPPIDIPSLNTKFLNKLAISLGIPEMMLIVRTIEIPFPTPFSVICSPIHINTAEPAVIAKIPVTITPHFLMSCIAEYLTASVSKIP